MERYPLSWPTGWPRKKSYQRARARFSKYDKPLSVHQGIQRVLDELQRLGVREGDAIISTNIKTRLDGLPYSDQREPEDPGVAVYWRKGATTKVMAVDRYDRVADNLAAIAATLEAMRAIERHGGAQILERAFTGFDALPAPGKSKHWRDVLDVPSNATLDDVRARYRTLRSMAHPDKGGDAARFVAIEEAWEQAQKELSA